MPSRARAALRGTGVWLRPTQFSFRKGVRRRRKRTSQNQGNPNFRNSPPTLQSSSASGAILPGIDFIDGVDFDDAWTRRVTSVIDIGCGLLPSHVSDRKLRNSRANLGHERSLGDYDAGELTAGVLASQQTARVSFVSPRVLPGQTLAATASPGNSIPAVPPQLQPPL
jgi:hypothetical protein